LDEAVEGADAVLVQLRVGGQAVRIVDESVPVACKGGASGVLAGRAVWTSALAADDPAELLRSDSVPRLEQLGATVDTHGRPWRDK
jgi:sulfofructosephosphate aldolase